MPLPELVPVESTAVAEVGYDRDERALYVRYHATSDGVYVYADVSPQQFDDLFDADSIGAYMNSEIKPKHPCRRLEPARRAGPTT